MGYRLEFNCLLVVSRDLLDLKGLQLGKTYHIIKDGERLYPLNIAIEVCDESYHYYGKVAVRKLTLEADKTSLDIEVLKIFTSEEAAVYTNAFVKPS